MTVCGCCGQTYTIEKEDDLVVDLQSNTMRCGDTVKRLTPKQAEALHVLRQRSPNVVAYDALFGALWGAGSDVPDNPRAILGVHVNTMRRHLNAFPWAIVNVHMRGFQLIRMKHKEGLKVLRTQVAFGLPAV